MPTANVSDTFLWIGNSGSAWESPADWDDLTTGTSPATVAPGAGSTVTIDGGSGLTIDGTGTTDLLAAAGAVTLIGTFDAGTVDLSGSDAGVVVQSGTAGSTANIGTLLETGTGDSFMALGSYTAATIDALGTIAGSILASARAQIDLLPTLVTVDGGTLNAGPLSGGITVGGTSGNNDIFIEAGATLAGSGTLLSGYDPGTLELNILSIVDVEGVLASSGFLVASYLDGSGTIDVVAGGSLDAALGFESDSELTVRIEAGASAHLASDVGGGTTIDFAGSDGSALFYTDDYAEQIVGLLSKITPADVLVETAMQGFTAGDRLFGDGYELGGIASDQYVQNGSTGTLTLDGQDGNPVADFLFDGTYTLSDFGITDLPPVNAVQFSGTAAIAYQIDLLPQTVFALSNGSGAGNSFTYTGGSGGAWGDAANWFDVTAGTAAHVAPGAGDGVAITGASGVLYTVITQAGDAGIATFAGNVAIEGHVAATAIDMSAAAATLMVTNGGNVTAGTLAATGSGDAIMAYGNAPNRAGGYVDITGAATLGAGALIAAQGGGRAQLAALVMLGGNTISVSSRDDVWNGTTFEPGADDSAVTIGTLNDAAAGLVQIDAGATLTDLSPSSDPSRIVAAMVDDGALTATNLVGFGLSGTGAVTVAAGGSFATGTLSADADITFTVGSGATLSLAAAGPITGGSFTLEGSLDTLSLSASQSFSITAPVSGFAYGDIIQLEIGPGYPGGVNPIAGATFVPGGAGGGTLELLDAQGNVVGGIALQGSYSGDRFIVAGAASGNVSIVQAEPGTFPVGPGTATGESFGYIGPSGGAWGDAANWQDTTTPSTIVAPGSLDSVTVDTNGIVLTGSGMAADLTLDSTGFVAVGTVTVGSLTATFLANGFGVAAGGTIAAGSMMLDALGDAGTPTVTIDGPGALLDVSGTLAGDLIQFLYGQGGIGVTNGATAAFGGVSITASMGPFPFFVSNAATLVLPTSMPSTAVINLSGSGDLLSFASPAASSFAVASAIAGFAAGDTIDIAFTETVDSVQFAQTGTTGETATLIGAGNTALGTLDLGGDYVGDTFGYQELAGNTTQITLAPPCFVAGTRILTARGEVEVESLQVGDLLPTVESGRLARVAWVGHRRVDCRRHPKPRDVWPVRVRADAFGAGQPHSDLFLSPDHAVFVDGVLIPIRYLTNGRSIVQQPRDAVAYWHVELERHDVILAEGLPCESFLDTGSRAAFENGGSVIQMVPDFALRVWEADACAPIVVAGPRLDRVRAMLHERAGSVPTVSSMARVCARASDR